MSKLAFSILGAGLAGCTLLRPLHTSAIMMGNSRQEVLRALECTLGKPMNQLKDIPEDEDLEALEFTFTTDATIVIWLYDDRLVQVNLKRPKDRILGILRPDYKTLMDAGRYPGGYFIANDGRKASITAVWK